MKEYLKNASKEMKNIHSLIGASLLGALNPILGMLTIHINQFLQIGFSSLTHAVTGYLYGPVLAMFAGGILDILKWILKETNWKQYEVQKSILEEISQI